MLRGSQSISDLSVTPDHSQNNLRGGGVSGKGKNQTTKRKAIPLYNGFGDRTRPTSFYYYEIMPVVSRWDGGRLSLSGSVSTFNLLHAISEEREDLERAAPLSNKRTPLTRRTGTAPSATAATAPVLHNPRVARSLGLWDRTTTSNTTNNRHPGCTQSDTEAASATLPRRRSSAGALPPIGVVTSPLAFRRRRQQLQGANKGVRPKPSTNSPSSASLNCPVSTNNKLAPSTSLSFSQSSTEDDSEYSLRSSGFGDYLKMLSACPRLSDSSAPSSRVSSPMGRQVVTTSKKRLSSTTSECEDYKKASFRVSEPVRNFPGGRKQSHPMTGLKSQMSLPLGLTVAAGKQPGESASDVSVCRLTSDSSGADTIVSDDVSFDDSGTLSEDSLTSRLAAEIEMTRRLREIVASMDDHHNKYETDTSEASFYVPPPVRRPRRRRRRADELAAMEAELRRLQSQLSDAERPRGRWDQSGGGGGFVGVKSLSTELFDNYTDNEKVMFSYENLSGGTRQQQLGSVDEADTAVWSSSGSVSMPQPVESAIKHMHPMRENAPHERYSPKPVRRQLQQLRRNFSSPSTPTSEYCPPWPKQQQPPVVVNFPAEPVSMPALGVTSMWIPADPSPRRLSGSGGLLSRKVFNRQMSEPLQQQAILPNKGLGD